MERFACGHARGGWGGSRATSCLELGYEIKRQPRLIRSLEFHSTLWLGKVHFHNVRNRLRGTQIYLTLRDGPLYCECCLRGACQGNYFTLKWLAFYHFIILTTKNPGSNNYLLC